MSFDQFDRFSHEVGSEVSVAERGVLECVPLSEEESLRRTCIVLRAERNFFQVQHARAVELTEDRGDSAGTVDVLHQVGAVRGGLADAGHALGDLVDVAHGEVELGLLGGGEDVQQGEGRGISLFTGASGAGDGGHQGGDHLADMVLSRGHGRIVVYLLASRNYKI